MPFRKLNVYILITVIILAVILIAWSVNNFKNKEVPLAEEAKSSAQEEKQVFAGRHPLGGQMIAEGEEKEYFPIAIMIDNSYDARPQAGIDQADIIYEALAEGNITRLIAIFDSNKLVDKIGPIRSARNYYMDWAEEYGGLYVHVGGSPQALSVIDTYDFEDVNQIGAGEIYFWRDENLDAPHNVFSSSANWLRAGEIKEVESRNNNNDDIVWNFVEPEESDFVDIKKNININFANSYYEVDWTYNENLKKYQRVQGGDKFYFYNGTQATADNIVVQVVDDYLIDEERRGMKTQEGGLVYIFNNHGYQDGVWLVEDGRTRFFNAQGEELKLVPGTTWVEVINHQERLEFE